MATTTTTANRLHLVTSERLTISTGRKTSSRRIFSRRSPGAVPSRAAEAEAEAEAEAGTREREREGRGAIQGRALLAGRKEGRETVAAAEGGGGGALLLLLPQAPQAPPAPVAVAAAAAVVVVATSSKAMGGPREAGGGAAAGASHHTRIRTRPEARAVEAAAASDLLFKASHREKGRPRKPAGQMAVSGEREKESAQKYKHTTQVLIYRCQLKYAAHDAWSYINSRANEPAHPVAAFSSSVLCFKEARSPHGSPRALSRSELREHPSPPL